MTSNFAQVPEPLKVKRIEDVKTAMLTARMPDVASDAGLEEFMVKTGALLKKARGSKPAKQFGPEAEISRIEAGKFSKCWGRYLRDPDVLRALVFAALKCDSTFEVKTVVIARTA